MSVALHLIPVRDGESHATTLACDCHPVLRAARYEGRIRAAVRHRPMHEQLTKASTRLDTRTEPAGG